MDPAPPIERAWPGRTATVEPLGGRNTNRSPEVTFDGEAFAPRLAGRVPCPCRHPIAPFAAAGRA